MKKANNRARWFYFQYIIYLIAIIISTVWAYARLEFVRSTDQKIQRLEK